MDFAKRKIEIEGKFKALEARRNQLQNQVNNITVEMIGLSGALKEIEDVLKEEEENKK